MATTLDGLVYWGSDGQPLTGKTITYRPVGSASISYTLLEDGSTGYYYHGTVEEGAYDVWVNGVKDALRSPRVVISSATPSHLTNYSNPHRVSALQAGAAPTASILGTINASSEVTKISPTQLQSIPPSKITGTAVIDSDARLVDTRTPSPNTVAPSTISAGYELMPTGSATKLSGIAAGAQVNPSASQIVSLLNDYDSTLLKTSAEHTAVARYVAGKESAGTYDLRHKGVLITAGDVDSSIVVADTGTIADPLNIRIYDVEPVRSNYFSGTGSLAVTVSKGPLTNKLRVMFRWNYDTLRITATGTLLTVDGYKDDAGNQITSSPSFSANELQGMYVYIPSKITSYRVLSNNGTSGGSTQCTLSTDVGVINHSSTDDWLCKLHNNAKFYAYQAVPLNGSVEVDDRVVEGVRAVVSSPVAQRAVLELDIGQRYYFRVQNIQSGEAHSDLATMPAGTYYHNSVAQSYGSPFHCVPALLSDSGMTLTLTASEYGFQAVIGGSAWDSATDYELVFNPKANGAADFDNVNHTKIISSDKTFRISTEVSELMSVKVRALIAGYVVGGPLSGETTSGGGGNAPLDEMLFQQTIDLRTFDVTLAAGTGSYDKKFADSTAISPANTAVSAANTISSGSLVGSWVYDTTQGKAFVIKRHRFDGTDHYIAVDSLSGQSGTIGNGAATINTIRRGRQIGHSRSLPTSYRITRMSAVCDFIDGSNPSTDPLKLRVYDSENESGFGALTVTTSDSKGAADLSLEVDAGKHLVIDAYDPENDVSYDGLSGWNDNTNSNSIRVTVTVFGRKKTVRELSNRLAETLSQQL